MNLSSRILLCENENENYGGRTKVMVMVSKCQVCVLRAIPWKNENNMRRSFPEPIFNTASHHTFSHPDAD